MRTFAFIILIAALLLPLSACAAVSPSDLPAGYVIAPSIGLYRAVYLVPIVDRAYSDAALAGRVGWLQDTAWIHDDFGPVALAGHDYSVFRDIDQLKVGDTIIMLDTTGAEVYTVTRWQIVAATNWQILAYTAEPVLLLITCEGDRRRVVRAERTGG